MRQTFVKLRRNYQVMAFLIMLGIIFTANLAHAAGIIVMSDLSKAGRGSTGSTVYFSGTGTVTGTTTTPTKNFTLVMNLTEPMSTACLDFATNGLLNKALKLTVQSNGTPYTADGVNYYASGIYQCELGY